MNKEWIFILVIMGMMMTLLWSAPPAPGSWWQKDMSFSGISENYGHEINAREVDLPQNILVLRCQFSDVTFDLDPSYPTGYPDALPHDIDYFKRFMFHLSAYWSDASAGNYQLTEDNYTVFPEVFTLQHEMSYYGDDDLSTERVSEMIVELLDMADSEIDFSEYDSFIIFHAGAGQEADTSGENAADLWTTFISRKTLQAGLDPENDNFPGLEYDGVILKEFVIVPETERQPDIKPGDALYGVLGVLCHEFGRQIGLPTLYDNQSSNGKSAGIGNFGVMGTGLWNAAGYVPPLPIAWCRIYLGWSEYEVIDSNTENVELTYPMNFDSAIPKIYKVMISEDEYYLLENRQQNPDGSIFVNSDGDSLATFSFQIVDGQQYYEEGHPYAGQPYFNFMTNTYAGCEWDFYLPGYGEGDALERDGSGICIWHVDEIVMREKFNPEEEINIPNGEEEHKAIDLEEADHIQDMDMYGYYGSLNDTYRSGNNDYFGYLIHNGLPWTPTAESYYGGIQLEISNISTSADEMTFNVSYEWSLDTRYVGINTLPAAFLDFGDGIEKLFYPMPNGDVFLWENDTITAQENIPRDIIPQCWAWMGESKKILIPAETQNVSSLHVLNEELHTAGQILLTDYHWAAPPMVITDENTGEELIALAFNSTLDEANNLIRLYDSDLEQIGEDYHIASYQICGNMMYDGNVHIPARDGNEFVLYKLDMGSMNLNQEGILMTEHELNNGILIQFEEDSDKRMIFTTKDSLLIQFQETDNTYSIEKEIKLPFICDSYPSCGDLDNNGIEELLYGGENSFIAIDYSGNIIRSSNELAVQDSSGVCAGVVPIDLNNDGKLEIVGLMSLNRLCIWENYNDNDFRLMHNYPVTHGSRSRLFPVFRGNTIYLPSDNGKIFRDIDHQIASEEYPVAYCDLQRTGYLPWTIRENEHNTESLFVDEETYIYPNPYCLAYRSTYVNGVEEIGKICVRVMLSKSEKVEVWIYDIAGNKVENGEFNVTPYSSGVYLIDVSDYSSGVYVARVKAGGEQRLLKFGIEK